MWLYVLMFGRICIFNNVLVACALAYCCGQLLCHNRMIQRNSQLAAWHIKSQRTHSLGLQAQVVFKKNKSRSTEGVAIGTYMTRRSGHHHTNKPPNKSKPTWHITPPPPTTWERRTKQVVDTCAAVTNDVPRRNRNPLQVRTAPQASPPWNCHPQATHLNVDRP
jgi:hypothetical protein